MILVGENFYTSSSKIAKTVLSFFQKVATTSRFCFFLGTLELTDIQCTKKI